MDFEKVESKNKSVSVSEQIIEAIKDGEFEPGSKIPSEREIASKMGVARTSVREALIALQTAGIVEVKKGRGAYVKSSANNRELIKPFLILNGDKDLLFALEAREAVEKGIAELALERGTSEDVRGIRKPIEQMREAVQNEDYEKYSNADLNFHLAVAKATNNPFVQKTLHSFINATQNAFWARAKQEYYMADISHVEKSFNYHNAIFQAIKSRDKESLSQAIKAHFQGVKRILKQISDEEIEGLKK